MHQLTSYLKNSPMGVIEIDRDFKVIAWGGRAEQIFGWKESEVIGRFLSELNLTYADDVESFLSTFSDLTEPSTGSTKAVFRNKARAGYAVHCQWYLSVQASSVGEMSSIVCLVDDITQNRIEQDNIFKLKERLDLITLATHDNIWDWDMVNNTIWTNENYIKTFGYDPRDYSNFHEEWLSRIHPDDQERCRESMRLSLDNKTGISEAEYRFKLADGRYGTIFSRSSLLLNQQGEPVRWVGLMSNITPRKEAEKKLAESEEKYRQLVDNMAEGLGKQDRDGNILFLNKHACDILGYRLEELIGKPFRMLFDEENQKIYEKQLALRKKGFSGSYEIEWTCKDGHKVATIINPSPIYNDKHEVIASSAVFTDITKRKEAERRLLNSENHLRTILQADPNCIKLLDREGRIIDINTSGLNIMEAESLENVRGVSIINLVLQPYKKPFLELIGKVFNGEKCSLEFRCMTLKGGPKWLETDAVPLKNEKGEVEHILAVTRDVTESKKTQLALKESESKFRRIFESDLIGFIFYDVDGNIIEANNKFAEMIGYSGEDLTSGQLSWRDLTPAEFAERDDDALTHISLKGSCEPYEKEFIRKDGSRFNLILGAVSINKNEGMAYIIDNSERKNTEKNLRKINTLLAEIQKLSHIGTWEWFPKSNKAVWSDEMFHILGIDSSSYEVKTDSIFKFVHPEDLERLTQATQQALTTQKGVPIEYRIIRKNGEVRHLYGLGYPVLDKHGNMERMVGSIQDITERKQAEDQIKKEKLLSDSIINSLPGVFYLFDHEGNFLRWNNNFEKITGYTADEIQKMHPADFVDPAEREWLKSKIAEVYETGLTDLEATLINKSGSKIPFRFTGSIVTFENRTCVIGMGMNISQRKAAEKLLKENERQLDVIYNTVTDIIFMLSVERAGQYKFISVNHRFMEATGLSEDKVIGKFVHEVIPDSSLSLVLEKYQEAIITRKTVSWEETTHYPAGIKTAFASASPVMDENGNCIRLVGSVHDITQRKQAEKEIRERNEQLYQLSAHLQNIREEERASVAREIHDELGQQLTVIKMDVSWIRKKILNEDEKVRVKIQGLLQLVDSAIQTVRKIASDLRPSILDDFGLKEALKWQCNQFENRTGIHCHFVATIPDKKFDKKTSITLFRIFQESLTNVARHAEAQNIWAMIKCRGSILELTITDDGIGMDLASMGSSHTMGFVGMKERVKMAEGTFNLISTPGKGTIIRVAVPYQFDEITNDLVV